MDDKLLLEMLIKQKGGQKKAEQEFVNYRLADALKSTKTIGQLLEKAKVEGWQEMLLAVKFSNLIDLPDSKDETLVAEKSTGEKVNKKAAPKRLTAKDKDKMVAGILDFLKEFPWSSKGEIAKAVGFDGQRVGIQIAVLKKDGKIKSKGERRNMVHALKAEKTKAPA